MPSGLEDRGDDLAHRLVVVDDEHRQRTQIGRAHQVIPGKARRHDSAAVRGLLPEIVPIVLKNRSHDDNLSRNFSLLSLTDRTVKPPSGSLLSGDPADGCRGCRRLAAACPAADVAQQLLEDRHLAAAGRGLMAVVGDDLAVLQRVGVHRGDLFVGRVELDRHQSRLITRGL